MFKVLSAKNLKSHQAEFSSMHRLRYRVFIEELKWPVGQTRAINGMEFDQFDIESAHYIVRINDDGEVDACSRVLPTTGPYMLNDVFGDLIQTIEAPCSDRIWETTRFCADRRSAPRNIVGQLVAAMLEFGLANSLTNYVSVSDIRIEPLLVRAGWTPQRLGEPRWTGTDTAAGEIFEVSQAALDRVREKSGITGPLLDAESLAPTLILPDQLINVRQAA